MRAEVIDVTDPMSGVSVAKCQSLIHCSQWRIQGGFLVAQEPPPPGQDF